MFYGVSDRRIGVIISRIKEDRIIAQFQGKIFVLNLLFSYNGVRDAVESDAKLEDVTEVESLFAKFLPSSISEKYQNQCLTTILQ